jgi:hypothetical protein
VFLYICHWTVFIGAVMRALPLFGIAMRVNAYGFCLLAAIISSVKQFLSRSGVRRRRCCRWRAGSLTAGAVHPVPPVVPERVLPERGHAVGADLTCVLLRPAVLQCAVMGRPPPAHRGAQSGRCRWRSARCSTSPSSRCPRCPSSRRRASDSHPRALTAHHRWVRTRYEYLRQQTVQDTALTYKAWIEAAIVPVLIVQFFMCGPPAPRRAAYPRPRACSGGRSPLAILVYVQIVRLRFATSRYTRAVWQRVGGVVDRATGHALCPAPVRWVVRKLKGYLAWQPQPPAA